MACFGCGVDGSKYKCASCRAPYCSVPCYKVHKNACKAPERAAVLKASAPTEGLVRTRSKRPYLQEREEVAYSATPEMLDRVSELEAVQNVLEILRGRDKRLKLDREPNEAGGEREADEDDNGPPEVISLKPRAEGSDVAESNRHQSVHTANTSSLMEHLADVIVQVCNAPTLEKKQHLMSGFLATDVDVDSFCDSILQLIGARNKEGQFIL